MVKSTLCNILHVQSERSFLFRTLIMPDHSPEISAALAAVESAVQQNTLTPSAAENLRTWLIDDRYADYLPEVLKHISGNMWKELDDAFWTIIPFGTGGRRGKMYPIGSNMVNDRTIGESAQGVADYVLSLADKPANPSCAI